MLAGLLISYRVAATMEGDVLTSHAGRPYRVTIVAERDDTKLTGRGAAMTQEGAVRAALADAWHQVNALAVLSVTPKEFR